MPYKAFYNLSIEPFSNAPVAKMYFASPQHEKSLLRLRYAVENNKGLAVCIGGIGAGKTTLARRLLDSLPDSQYEAALLVIVHSGVSANWLLKRIALQLGVPNPGNEKLTLLSQLFRRLVQIYEAGKKAVVLIDEAQMLKTREIMEEFRGLLNLEVPGRKLLNFIFFGLPELDDSLRMDEPLRQRVAVRSLLLPLNGDGVTDYVTHRMRLAGAPNPVYTPEALMEIHRLTGGVPRLINTLCDNTLFEGAILKRERIDALLVREVARELDLLPQEEAPTFTAPPLPAAPAREIPVIPPRVLDASDPGPESILSVPPPKGGESNPLNSELDEFDRLIEDIDDTRP